MGVKPVTRSELISRILDADDAEISARALVRGFPAVISSLDDLVEMVSPGRVLSPDLFDVLCDAYADVHPAVLTKET